MSDTKAVVKEPTHVDDFADNCGHNQTPAVKYARWFFFLHRLAAVYQQDWRDQISQYKLFCNYQGKRYRVTGASRMGDVWLATDFNRETGYDLRVNVDDCSSWSQRVGHTLVHSGGGEWDDEYTCTVCGAKYSYAAEDCANVEFMNSQPALECGYAVR